VLSSGGREAASLGWGGPATLEVVAGGRVLEVVADDGVPAVGVAGRWVEVRDDLLFSIFYWTDKWAPVHVSTYRTSSALKVGPTCQIRCQFTFNSRSMRIVKNYPRSRGFL
jgi:hypothetical protein